jgi:RNA polymerase sigma factor (sigma-70 family)
MVRVLPFALTRIAKASFEALLRPHVEYLHRLAWRFTGSTADAEDLVQDVLLKLYPRSRQLAAVEQLRPWLAKVLYRTYVDFARRQSRSPASGLADDAGGDEARLDAFPTAEDGPPELAERGERRERLLAALQKLNPEQRAVVVMHDIEGYVLEELESVLQAPLGTLKSRLHRARQQLRADLGMEPFAASERVKR